MVRTSFSIVVMLAAAGPAVLRAQAPHYRLAQLPCSAFDETVRTEIRGASGTATVQSRAGREGLLVVRLRDSTAGMVAEARYDSLTVWRGEGIDREAPDTDGLIGGIYRGILTPDGRYRPIREPYVPGELAEVAELATAMDDFLPRLPGTVIDPGGEWSDSGYTVKRLSDRHGANFVAHRYRWTATGRRGERIAAGDSSTVTLDQAIEEEGEMLWTPEHGPLSWSRRIRVSARIPATGGVRRAVRSVVEQRIDVVRRFDLTPDCR